MLTSSETKKIGVVVVVLVILLVGILVIRKLRKPAVVPATTNQTVVPSPTQILEVPPGVYSIELNPKSIKIDEKTEAKIIFTARDKKIAGSDIILKFNPDYLEADEKVTTGDFFASFPRNSVNNKEGLIKVIGFSSVSDNAVESPVTVFTVLFKAKKAGSTKISFDFALGRTNLTTLVEKGTSRNILGTVKDALVTIEQ